MSALAISQSVVQGQQTYAKEHNLSTLFEVLTVSLLSSKPKDALGFLHTQLSEMAQSGGEAKLPPIRQGIDTEANATEYLVQQNIHILLEELLTTILIHKPASPVVFLRDELHNRITLLQSGQSLPSFYTDNDLKGIHSLFDSTHINVITVDQARTAIKTLGANPDDSIPSSYPSKPIDVDTFVQLAREALNKVRSGSK